MKAKLIYLSERQVDFLKDESQRLGTKVSELIRRILDAHIDIEKEYENGINKKDPI